jgi:hypothetical protein
LGACRFWLRSHRELGSSGVCGFWLRSEREMASYLLEDFVGNGVLKDQVDMLLADGWDDVPTLKMMTPEDMDLLQLSQFHRVICCCILLSTTTSSLLLVASSFLPKL